MKMLSDTTVQELRQIFLEVYGRDVTMQETSEIANGLVGYFDLLAKIKHRTQQNQDENGTQNN